MGADRPGAVAPAPGSPPEPDGVPRGESAPAPAPPAPRAGGDRAHTWRAGLRPGALLARLSALPAVVLAGWLAAAYPLVLGRAATPVVTLLAAAPVVVLLLAAARRLPPIPHTPWWPVLATVVVAVGFGVLAAVQHGGHVVLRRDPAVYALAAHWLAGHASLLVPTDHAATGGPFPPVSAGSPGFYDQGEAVVPQFMSGTAIALLPGGWLAGFAGILTLPALYGTLALLAVAGLTARLVGPRWAPVAALALGLCEPEQLSARATLSEPVAQLLLLGGLCLLVDAGARLAGGPARRVAAVAGLVLGLGALVRIEALREVVLLVPVLAWLAARRRPQWMPLAGGIAVAGGLAALDAAGSARPYVADLMPLVRSVLALGAVLLAGCAAAAVAARRLVPALRAAGRLDPLRRIVAAGGAAAVLGTVAYLVARPWLQTVRQAPTEVTRIIAGMQLDQGLAPDGTRNYAEQSVRWVSWYVGWPALALAAAAAAVLVWRMLRGRDERWALALPVLLASSVLVLYRPAITPDHPWADRRLVPTVLPTATLLAVAAVAAISRTARRWSRLRSGPGWLTATPVRVRAATARLAVPAAVLLGAGVLVVPAASASWPLLGARTEAGETAAVELACAAFGPDDVALLVDARSRQEWLPALRQVCEVPAFAVPGEPSDDAATPEQVDAAAARVRGAGGRPVLVAQSGEPLPRLTDDPQRRIVHLVTSEPARLLLHRPQRLAPLSIELWVAAAD